MSAEQERVKVFIRGIPLNGLTFEGEAEMGSLLDALCRAERDAGRREAETGRRIWWLKSDGSDGVEESELAEVAHYFDLLPGQVYEMETASMKTTRWLAVRWGADREADDLVVTEHDTEAEASRLAGGSAP